MLRFTVAITFHTNGSLVKEIWTDYFLVREYFEWLIDYNNWDAWFVTVPAWFKTDLSSIPKILRIFFDTNRVSWILHDYLFKYKTISYYENWEVKTKHCWFFKANWIYYKALRVELVSRKEAFAQFIGLCLWGWYTYFITYRNYGTFNRDTTWK